MLESQVYSGPTGTTSAPRQRSFTRRIRATTSGCLVHITADRCGDLQLGKGALTVSPGDGNVLESSLACLGSTCAPAHTGTRVTSRNLAQSRLAVASTSS